MAEQLFLPKGLRMGDWLTSDFKEGVAWRKEPRFSMFVSYYSNNADAALVIKLGSNNITSIFASDEWKRCERPNALIDRL